jgi:hypothetical protein
MKSDGITIKLYHSPAVSMDFLNTFEEKIRSSEQIEEEDRVTTLEIISDIREMCKVTIGAMVRTTVIS